MFPNAPLGLLFYGDKGVHAADPDRQEQLRAACRFAGTCSAMGARPCATLLNFYDLISGDIIQNFSQPFRHVYVQHRTLSILCGPAAPAADDAIKDPIFSPQMNFSPSIAVRRAPHPSVQRETPTNPGK